MPRLLPPLIKRALCNGLVKQNSFTKFYFMKGDLNSLAVICRKSILKKAVDRNRLRRVYKACFNDLKEALPQGMYVAVVKRGVVSVDRRHQYQEVSKEWLVLIKSL